MFNPSKRLTKATAPKCRDSKNIGLAEFVIDALGERISSNESMWKPNIVRVVPTQEFCAVDEGVTPSNNASN